MAQSGLGSYGLPRSLLNPVAVVGRIVSFDWSVNTATVKTNEYGLITCRIGTSFSDTDWPESGSAPAYAGDTTPNTNRQYGHKRPYRARERVVVLLLGNCRVANGVIVCSLKCVEHKLNTATEFTGKNDSAEHSKKYPVNKDQWILHIPNAYWFRALKTAMMVSVEELLLRSEDSNVTVEGYQNVTVLAEKGNIEATADEGGVKVTATRGTIETMSQKDTTVIAHENITAMADQSVTVTAGIGGVGGDVTVESTFTGSTARLSGKTAVVLGAATAKHTAALADGLLAVFTLFLSALSIWASTHVHPCTAPGAPSGPSVVPFVPVETAWNSEASLKIPSILVKLEK